MTVAAARCLDCGYVLEHLDADRCPECGRGFDLADAESFSRKPPKVSWRLWMPGFALALGSGLLAWFVLLTLGLGWGWATTIAVPLSAGALLGYGCRTGPALQWLILIVMLAGMGLGLITAGLAGILCFTMLAGVFLVPLLLSWGVGVLLRYRLKDSKWDQAAHLPIVLGLVGLPYAVALVEGRVRPAPATSVTTTIDLPVAADAAFAAWQFYEDVGAEVPRPWLLNLSPALRPATVVGDPQAVGDTQTCHYEKGRLTKRITELDAENRRIAFTVIEQVDIEDETLQLLGGSMTFEPLPGGGCRATLVTTYRPLIRPRVAWRPAEVYAMRSVHRHVLAGIEREARAGT